MTNIKGTILVVDDAPANIDVIKTMLADDYLVQAAVNGKIALKIATKKKPNIILLDIHMPEMNGFEVCAILKSAAETSHIPIVFISAEIKEDDIKKMNKLGAAGHLKKPVSQVELSNLISSLIVNCASSKH